MRRRGPPYRESLTAALTDQRGIAGLDGAIVLISFVVVSSIFSFVALSAGLATSDSAKSTMETGLSEAQGSLELRSGVKAETTLSTTALTIVAAEALGTGDGVGKAFSLANAPALSNSETVFVAGVAKTRGTDYSVDYSTGAITFTEAPASAAAIAADYRHGQDFVGTGDGSTKAFALSNKPVIPGNGLTVYVNGSAKTQGADYLVDYDTGVVTFNAAPATGDRLDATYTSYTIDNVVLTLSNAAGGRPIDMTGGRTIMTYMDADTLANDITNYSPTRLGLSDANNLLEEGEVIEYRIDVSGYGLTNDDEFTVSVIPVSGPVLVLKRTIPARILAHMELG